MVFKYRICNLAHCSKQYIKRLIQHREYARKHKNDGSMMQGEGMQMMMKDSTMMRSMMNGMMKDGKMIGTMMQIRNERA
jgi:hypothetical protein